MVAQRHPKNKKKPLRSEEKKRAKNKKTRAVPKPGGCSKIPDKNNSETGNAVTKTRNALDLAQIDDKPTGDVYNESRKTPPKAREKSPVPPDTGQERKVHIRRDSFVVRLSLDENNQCGRTEIEHIASSRKQNFLELNGDHLVAFMKACINPQEALKSPTPISASSELVRTSTPTPLQAEANLLMVDSRVLHAENQNFMSLVLSREESFVVEVRFQLQRPHAQYLTTYASSFEIKLYANEVTSGESKLLTTYSAKLIQDLLEYTASTKVPRLAHGLYRLFTLVTLSTPIKIGGYHDGPVIQVI